jgi:hypothetical protein
MVFLFMEIWKDIEGYEGYYQVSNLGRVKSLRREVACKNGMVKTVKEKILKQKTRNDGYKEVNLNRKGKGFSKAVHRLVALSFISNSENKRDVNHKDGIKTNNNLMNLEWCTTQENTRHSIDVLNMKTTRKLNMKDVEFIREAAVKGHGGNVLELANQFNVHRNTIMNVISNKLYKL